MTGKTTVAKEAVIPTATTAKKIVAQHAKPWRNCAKPVEVFNVSLNSLLAPPNVATPLREAAPAQDASRPSALETGFATFSTSGFHGIHQGKKAVAFLTLIGGGYRT